MGQKVISTIFQITKTENWNYKYTEKKKNDFYLYTAKNLEIKKFILKFFKQNGLNIHNCKINYLNNSLNIFLSYKQNLKSIDLLSTINKNQNIIITKNTFAKQNLQFNNLNIIVPDLKNYLNYKKVDYKKKTKTKISKIQRIKILKYYKQYLNLKENKNIDNIKKNNFLNSFFQSINLFYNKLVKINLILKPLNNNIKKIVNQKKHILLQKKMISLQKYQRNEFFKEGINLMFLCIRNKNSAYLLSDYISTNLKKLKNHNFFLRFIKTTLTILRKTFPSLVKGIKIKVKGRINRRPRAKHKNIIIGNVPLITLSSCIDYSETTAYTSNGTLGVKIWICKKP